MKTHALIALLIAAVLPFTACVTETGDDTAEVTAEVTADPKVVDEATLDTADAPQIDTSNLAQLAAYVGVPSNYVYNPRLGSLHDYCTKSPDEFPNPVGANANFRGPCARHDLCLGARISSQTCNNRLWSDMVSNCQYTYSIINPARQACINTAHVYWVAVTINTHL
jgi:hypothetical protein